MRTATKATTGPSVVRFQPQTCAASSLVFGQTAQPNNPSKGGTGWPLSSGTPTLENSWTRNRSTAGAIPVDKGNSSGNRVAWSQITRMYWCPHAGWHPRHSRYEIGYPLRALMYCCASLASVSPSLGSCSFTQVQMSAGKTRRSCSRISCSPICTFVCSIG